MQLGKRLCQVTGVFVASCCHKTEMDRKSQDLNFLDDCEEGKSPPML